MSLEGFLGSIVQEQGREILHKRGPVLGLMADRYPNDKRGLRLIKVAYETGVVEDLLKDGSDLVQHRSVPPTPRRSQPRAALLPPLSR